MAGGKKTHNIYLINIDKVRHHFELEEDAEKTVIIERIMEHDQQFVLQELKNDIDTNPFSVMLFFRIEYAKNNKFASFCSNFIEENQEAITFRPTSSSSVMFIWNDNNIYAITTGQGFRMVENYAIPKFGLIIATAYEHNFRITALQSTEMSSIIQSSQTIYTTEVAFQSVDKLDTIFKGIGGRINSARLVHDLLDLDDRANKSSMRLKARDYIQFGNSLDFKGLLHVLQMLDAINVNEHSDGFNTISQLNKKKDSSTINALNNEVIHSIYNALENGNNSPFDLFHQETDSFIFADSYQVYCNGDIYVEEEDYKATPLLSKAFSKYLGDKESSEDDFNRFFKSSRIKTITDNNTITDGSMLSHVFGEVEYDGKLYYAIDGKYYLQTETYVRRLNDFLKRKLQIVNITNEIKTGWPQTKNEDWFNQTVSQKERFIQLHRVEIENIEFADLIKISEGFLTIVHVKDGFDGEMRVLDRQVEMSIKMITDILYNNNDTLMRKLYRNAVNNHTSHLRMNLLDK